jgi:dihydroneopterin aldolase
MIMDIVYIRDLRIDTIIGIYDWERQVRQTVSLDLEMATDIRRAAATDDIQYALNYKAVSKRLIAYVENRNALLIETLAEELAGLIREEFNVPWLRLRLSKPGAVRGARDVGLVIERGQLPIEGAMS